MKYLSVCDGIGAAHVAWKPLGWKCVGASEVAAFPKAVVRHNHPEIPELGDMTKYHEWNIEHPDLVCGGTPCQSFSVAGLRAGLADPRGNLALVFLGIVDHFRPSWVVWENVPGVYSAMSHNAPDPCGPGMPVDVGHGEERVVTDEYDADEDHAFACFVAGLQELGYGVFYRTLDAQYFNVAQRRNRVFVVGYIGDWRPATAVLLEPHSMSGNPPPSRSAGERPAPTIASRPSGGGGLGTDFDLDGGLVQSAIPETVGALTDGAHNGGGLNGQDAYSGRILPVAFKVRGGGEGTGERGGTVGAGGGVGYLGQEECAFTLSTHEDQHVMAPVFGFRHNASASDTGVPQEELAPSLRTNDQGSGVMAPMAIAENQQGVLRLSTTSPSLGTGGGKPGQGYPAAMVGMAVRRLTPRECERLQAFPDNYTMIPWRGKPAEECPDGPRYKGIGNSWATVVPGWIGRRIAMVEEILQSLKA